jgi:hypothetical protein
MTTFFTRRRQAQHARGALPAGVTGQGQEVANPGLSSTGLSLGEKVAALATVAFSFGMGLTVAIQSRGRHGLGLAILTALFFVLLGRNIRRRLTREHVDGREPCSNRSIVR